MDMHTTRAIDGAALAPLSREHKRNLVLWARRAYNILVARGTALQPFDDWRHREQKLAVERASLTLCTNEDYLFLLAHFMRMAGRTVEAQRTVSRAVVEPRTWAMARFDRECRKAADVLPAAREYAAGFLRNARGVDLDDASERMLWHAIFVIRRKASQLRRKFG
jgi:hypothetical protein